MDCRLLGRYVDCSVLRVCFLLGIYPLGLFNILTTSRISAGASGMVCLDFSLNLTRVRKKAALWEDSKALGKVLEALYSNLLPASTPYHINKSSL